MVSYSPKNQPRSTSQSSKWIGTHKRGHVLSLLKNSKPLLLLSCIVQFWISTWWHKWISWWLTRETWMIHDHTNRPLSWKLPLSILKKDSQSRPFQTIGIFFIVCVVETTMKVFVASSCKNDIDSLLSITSKSSTMSLTLS